MSQEPRCVRCAGPVLPPGVMTSQWRCQLHGAVEPFYVAEAVNQAVATTLARRSGVPVWVPWPLPTGWTVTGFGWAGDERRPLPAAVVACTGPAPLGEGPADVLFIAEEPGVGLGAQFAGIDGPDPGADAAAGWLGEVPHAKIVACGHPTPLWSVGPRPDRSAYIGEAKGCWMWTVGWPEDAGYVLAEDLVLCDLREDFPIALPYGAPSPYLRIGR